MTIFEPYAHQVAGHSSIFKLDGMVCKHLIPREYQFYQTIYNSFPQLIPLIPEFHGSITLHSPSSSIVPSSPSSSPSDAASVVPFSSACDESDDVYEFVVLQDLTAGMLKPCAMDMKVGTRHRFPTSKLLGYRLCGMRVHRWAGLYAVDRLFGRGLTPENVEDPVAAFLFDGERVRTELIPSILQGLHRIISTLKDPSFPFRFYTSSLLFIYEGDQSTQTIPHVDLKIIDFAHAIPKSDKDGEDDDGFLFGLQNLVVLFKNILMHHSEKDNKWALERDIVEDSLVAPL